MGIEYCYFCLLGTYPSPKACASLVVYKDSLVLFGGWSHPTPYPLHQVSSWSACMSKYIIITATVTVKLTLQWKEIKKKIKVILGTKQFKLSRFKVFLKYVINDCVYKFLEEL